RARPGQEAGADPVGDIAQPQVEAGRLDLAFDERIGRQNQPVVRHRRDHAVGKNATGIGLERERQFPQLTALDRWKVRLLPGYPKVALTERARRNMTMTYPVVI